VQEEVVLMMVQVIQTWDAYCNGPINIETNRKRPQAQIS